MDGAIADNVVSIRKWIDDAMDEIDKVPREMFRKILLYAIIDCFAQNWKGYPLHDSSKAFEDFLIEFAHEYREMLCEICPTTLYYDYSTKYDMNALKLPSFHILTIEDTGITPNDYILMMRIRHAKELLCNSNRSISHICNEVGFSSTSHFIRQFKLLEGITPARYRLLHGQKR